MDAQEFLANFLTGMAYALPLSLVVLHLGRDGWKLGPPFYTGLAACLATIAMTARVTAFLSVQLAEPDAGWFTKETLIALFTCFLAGLSISVFGWAIPSIKRRCRSIPMKFKSYGNGKQVPATEFDLTETEHKRQPNFFQAGFSAIWELAAILFTLMLIGAYLGWPSLILTIDQHGKQEAASAQKRDGDLAEKSQRQLKSYAMLAGTAANELLITLRQRQTICKTDRCTELYTRRLDEVFSAMSGWGLHQADDGLFRIGAFASALPDHEMANGIHAKLKGLAKKFGIILPSEIAASHAVAPSVEPANYQIEFEQKRVRSNTQLAERITATVTSPTTAIISLTHDLTMAFALVMELVAITMTFMLPLPVREA